MSWLKTECRAIACAIQFLTRIPIATKTVFDNSDYSNSLAWYPLVGLLMGGILLLMGELLFETSSVFLGAAIILTVWVLLTGALHLDGVGDCADAWVGGFSDPKRTLTIFKDPRSGPIAVVVLVLLLLLKWAALTVLIGSQFWLVIGLIPLISRSAIPFIFWRFNYISSSGLGTSLADGLSVRRVIFSLLVVALSVSALLAGQWKILCLFFVIYWAIILWWKRACYKKLGGFNGDCAGAVIELLELGLLLGLAFYTNTLL